MTSPRNDGCSLPSAEQSVRLHLNALAHGMERGSVRLVAACLADQGFARLATSLGDDANKTIEEARAWLLKAEAFEAEHGPGSRLERHHPWNTKHMPAIEQYLTQRR